VIFLKFCKYENIIPDFIGKFQKEVTSCLGFRTP